MFYNTQVFIKVPAIAIKSMKKKKTSDASYKENNLEEQALSQLNSAKYKDAISLYKKLLQDSDNDEWQKQLAYCYLQRALAFAEKGMFKEALVLWENHSQYAKPPYEAFDHYISWVIQSKNQNKIQSCLKQLTVQQLDKQYPHLAAALGSLLITEYSGFQQYLPQDSVFIAHYKIVQTGLQAYQDNELEKLSELLKKIPYRSAFRDFRTLLNAVIAVSESIDLVQAQLVKIPADSAYSQTARLLLACTKEGAELTQDLMGFSHKQCKIIGEVKGLDKKQLQFIELLNRQKHRLSDKIKFNLAIQFQSLCGAELAQQFCQSMLATYSAGSRDYKKSFSAGDEFTENRVKALINERDGNIHEAIYYWRVCVRLLSRAETENNLKIAFILRHIASFEQDFEETEALIESLEYDPEDRECYLQILKYYGQQQETIKEYKQWLSKTLEKFPQDIDFLILAINTAIRNKAYKKANQYATKLLKIDPLNTFAKQVLFSSHLSHARWLIQGKKYHLVEQEIQQAANLKMGKDSIIQTQLMRGLFYFAGQDKKQGLQLIAESFNKINLDPINTQFQAAMEALLTGLPLATILRELPPAKDCVLSQPELTRLIKQLEKYAEQEDDPEKLVKALEKIKPALKKSLSQQDYDEEILLTLCQTLDTIKHFELLRHCAKVAVAKWHKPIWVYYRVYSETNGKPEKCSTIDLMQLQTNQGLARKDKDHRATVLIDNFLDRHFYGNSNQGLGFLDDIFGDEDDYDDDPFEELFGNLPDAIFSKINNKIESLMKKTSPEKLAKDVSKACSGKVNVLQAMMQNPDLFMALMILKAADQLGIDIDVSVDDVLEVFEVNKQSSSFPFPF